MLAALYNASYRLVMYSKCFRELDLDDNLIGELGSFEIMRALTKREQRTSKCHHLSLSVSVCVD